MKFVEVALWQQAACGISFVNNH